MRRLKGTIDKNNRIILSDETIKHARVIRLNVGENVEILTSEGVYDAVVSSINPLTIQNIGKNEINRELDFNLILFCPLLKGEKFEFVLQKATELGVKEIYPFLSKRVIKRIDNSDFLKRKDRYNKIINEAILQSNRNSNVILHDLCSLDELKVIDASYKFIAYEDEAIDGIHIPNLKLNDKSSVICCFGPEGGFDRSEVEDLIKRGFISISLGKRILRAETAALYMLSVVGYLGERD